MCCLVLRSNCALLLTIQFASLFFILFFFFSAKILSRPYLWNRYSLRLQIECDAWSCCLIVHCSLPSNSLRYFFFFATILSGPYLWNSYSQRLQIECASWSCRLILHCCLLSNSLCYFFFFSRHDFVRRRVFHLRGIAPRSHTGRPRTCLVSDPRRGCFIVLSMFFFFFPPLLSPRYLWNCYSQRLQIECAAWSCCLILHYCLPSNSLRYFIYIFFSFFPPRFCLRDISGTVTRRDSRLSVLLGPAV